MPSSDYPTLVAQQREYFLAGHTRPAAGRRSQLEAVKALFTDRSGVLATIALKPAAESRFSVCCVLAQPKSKP